MINHITSRKHPLIQDVARLHAAKYRKQYQQFIAEGIRTIQTLCQRMRPLAIFCQQEQLTLAQELIDDAHIHWVTPEVMLKLSSSATPPGIVALFAIPTQPTQPLQAGLVLAEVTNPGNMGTMMRMAAAMQLPSVVIVGGTDPWSPKVVQASAGTLGLLQLYQYDWPTLLKEKNQLPLIALVVSGGAQPESIKLRSGLIVVGNEAHGIPDAWLADCAQRCTLPMPGNTESLNAAIATSIVLYIAYVQQASSH